MEGKVDSSQVRGHERHHPEDDSRPGLETSQSQPGKDRGGGGRDILSKKK